MWQLPLLTSFHAHHLPGPTAPRGPSSSASSLFPVCDRHSGRHLPSPPSQHTWDPAAASPVPAARSPPRLFQTRPPGSGGAQTAASAGETRRVRGVGRLWAVCLGAWGAGREGPVQPRGPSQLTPMHTRPRPTSQQGRGHLHSSMLRPNARSPSAHPPPPLPAAQDLAGAF